MATAALPDAMGNTNGEAVVVVDVGALGRSLKQAAQELPCEALPMLLAGLEEVKAVAWMRLVAPPAATASTASPPVLLSAKQMAAQLHVHESWLREHARQGDVPCVHVGRYVRFDPAQVLAALKARGDHRIPDTAGNGSSRSGSCCRCPGRSDGRRARRSRERGEV